MPDADCGSVRAHFACSTEEGGAMDVVAALSFSIFSFTFRHHLQVTSAQQFVIDAQPGTRAQIGALRPTVSPPKCLTFTYHHSCPQQFSDPLRS